MLLVVVVLLPKLHLSRNVVLFTHLRQNAQKSRRTTTLCTERATKRKKSNTEKLHMLAAPGTNDEPHPGQQITATPPTPAPARRPPTTAIANLDGLPDRRRRRRSYLREQRRQRRRHLSVWETQRIRPLPQRLPSAEQASILMYYTAAVSKETQPGHVTA